MNNQKKPAGGPLPPQPISTPAGKPGMETDSKQGPLVQESLVPLLKYLSIRDPEVRIVLS